MPIQTDAEFEEFITSTIERSRESEAIRDDIAKFMDAKGQGGPEMAAFLKFLGSKSPSNREYPGLPTFEDLPDDYERQPMESYYFYYFGIEASTGRLISYVFHAKGSAVDPDIIDGWIKAARKDGAGSIGNNPDGVLWDGPCYLGFAVDATGWEFWEKDIDGTTVNASLYFHEVELLKDGKEVKHRKNTTFVNAKTLRDTILPVLLVENFNIKYGKKRKRWKKEEEDHYKFDIYIRVAFDPPLKDAAGVEQKLTLVIDPTGTNKGP